MPAGSAGHSGPQTCRLFPLRRFLASAFAFPDKERLPRTECNFSAGALLPVLLWFPNLQTNSSFRPFCRAF